MESLVRTRVGSFYLKDSITLQELEEKRDRNLLESCIVSVEELFADFPGVHTAEMYDILVRNGNRIGNNMLKEKTVENKVRMYDSSGLFVGIYEYDPGRKDYKPLKMFL